MGKEGREGVGKKEGENGNLLKLQIDRIYIYISKDYQDIGNVATSVCRFITDAPFTLFFAQEERETAEEKQYCHSLPGGNPSLEHHWQEPAVIAYLIHFSVCLCLYVCIWE